MMADASRPSSRRRLTLGILATIVLVGGIATTVVLSTRGAPSAAPAPTPSAAVDPEPAPMPTRTPEPVTSVCPAGPAAQPASGIPTDRAINVGVEDLVDGRAGHLAELATRMDQVGANTVSISVGRLDWIEFPWAGQERNLASDVIETDATMSARQSTPSAARATAPSARSCWAWILCSAGTSNAATCLPGSR